MFTLLSDLVFKFQMYFGLHIFRTDCLLVRKCWSFIPVCCGNDDASANTMPGHCKNWEKSLWTEI